MEKWKKIGVVGVDSGQLMICDPCYIGSEWKEEKYGKKVKHDFSYNGICQKTIKNNTAQINYHNGNPGIAVAFQSGFGDGCYEVYAKEKDFGKFGKRIVEVKIVMDSEEQLKIFSKLLGR
jgi:hypothetical protein